MFKRFTKVVEEWLEDIVRRIERYEGIRKRPLICPRRRESPMSFISVDYWRLEKNKDRTCSFCGSIHPKDFLKLLELAIEYPKKCRIERSDKCYKFYIHRPDIKNASEGAIKFYTQHVVGDLVLATRIGKLWKQLKT